MEKQETMTSEAVTIEVQLVVEDVVVGPVVVVLLAVVVVVVVVLSSLEVLSSLSGSLSLGSPSSPSLGLTGSIKFGSGIVG